MVDNAVIPRSEVIYLSVGMQEPALGRTRVFLKRFNFCDELSLNLLRLLLNELLRLRF